MAADLGQQALAISDHGVLNGWLAHRKGCREEGIIPVFGVEAYWRPDRRVREKEWRYRRWHLVLLAKNLAGWHNLIRLTSEAHNSGFYQNACIDNELLREHREGLICTTSCVSGPLAFLLRNGSDRQVNDHVDEFLSIFGDDLYFSIMPHAFSGQREHNVAVAQIAARVGRPVVHEKDKHYPEAGWEETQKIAILTGINKTFAESDLEAQKRIDAGEDPYELWHPNLNISTEQEDRALYAEHHPDLPESLIDEAMNSTEEILAKVDPISIDRTLKMPRVFVPENDSAKAQVLRWCREGLKEMGRDGDPVYEERLQYESSVVDQVGAWEYFWVVADVVRWCRSDAPLPPTQEDPDPPRKKPIRLNSGRGSAAASLICRTAKITMINPITHKFKFERFMNPERRSMPDVDLDVASTRRGEVKEYMARRHGRGSIADIVAFQHFQPRAALKAVAKTMYGFESEAYKRVAVLTHENTGCIDPVNDVDLDLIREREPDLAKWAEDFPVAWEHAVRLENHGDPSVLRMSKHAAGVALVPGEVSSLMPTVKPDESEQMPRTAWAETTKVSVTEEIGVVKIDFLGLSGMDRQQMILDLVQEHTGKIIDVDALPFLDDPYAVEDDVMGVFREGLTLGINQFSGDGITRFVKDAAPENIVDLAAINALFRPGPLGSGGHNRFVKRRRGVDVPDYPPVLHEVLGDTALTISFQEQVMELFERLADYTPGEADNVRKIIAKYYRDKSGLAQEKLAELEAVFVPRAAEKIGQELAESLWQEILPYSGYCLTGDTVVIRGAAGKYSKQEITLAELAEAWKARTPLGDKLRSRGVTLLALDSDGRIRPAYANHVWSNGLRSVYKVKTVGGREIRGTDNHRLLTDAGYTVIGSLAPGDNLVVMGDRQAELDQKRFIADTETPILPDAAKAIVLARAQGKCEFCDFEDTGGEKHSLEFAHIGPLEKMGILDRYHDPFNVRLLCNPCHKTLDYRKGERKVRHSTGKPTALDPILSIDPDGFEEVFDVSMRSDEHNFIANGIVSHNSFNRAHAGSYVVQAEQDAWLKKHYPLFSYSTYLTLDEDKTLDYLREARHPMFGLSILPPDVNVSGDGFTPDVEANAIRFGLRGIKGIGEAVAQQIVADRPFASLEDFEQRESRKYSKVNKKAREILIQVGALDSLGARSDWDSKTKAGYEAQLLGVALEPDGILGEDADVVRSNIHSEVEVAAMVEGQEVIVAGKVVDMNRTRVKKQGRMHGRAMATGIKVALDLEQYVCVCFPDQWDRFEEQLGGEGMVIIRGKLDSRGTIIINDVMDLEQFIHEQKYEEVAA